MTITQGIQLNPAQRKGAGQQRQQDALVAIGGDIQVSRHCPRVRVAGNIVNKLAVITLAALWVAL